MTTPPASRRPASTAIPPGDVERTAESSRLDEAYRQHWDRLLGLATGILGDRSTAEDAVQDAYVAATPHLERIEHPYSYLRRAVVNTCSTALRRRHRWQPLTFDIVSEDAPPRVEQAWTALQGLSPRRRTALILRFHENLAISEIAELMDCRDGTVSSLIHRGLTDLRREFKQP